MALTRCAANDVAYWLRQDGAKGSHKISAQKFKYIKDILSVGASVLVTDIDVVYIQVTRLRMHMSMSIYLLPFDQHPLGVDTRRHTCSLT